MRTEEFTYELPVEAIRQRPVEPRDSSRLLDTRDMSDHHFRDLPGRLREGDLLVVNSTKVRAARLRGRRTGGGTAELLLLGRDSADDWLALGRPARRLRPGTEIEIEGMLAVVESNHGDGSLTVRLRSEDPIEEAIERAGRLPLPPYIKVPLADQSRYQTVYADRVGSAAAPTAGLHFTERLVEEVRSAGIGVAQVELEVGVDTFRPITSSNVEQHQIHCERFAVPEATVAAVAETRDRGGRVVAVGTTVVRALETQADQAGGIVSGEGTTGIFMTPGFRFEVTDLLVTNFHLPASPLIVLVAAFVGERWREIYATALQRGYRFLSFGDAMLAERSG